MENQATENPRDGGLKSIWQTEPLNINLATAPTSDVYDVLVVGGGITGLTSALLLAENGQSVVLAEAHTLGFGTTGGTSAHLNTFFDSTYPEIESGFGKDAAKLVALAGTQAMQLIEGFIKKYNIDCDFEYKDGYLFSENEKETKLLDEILEASQRAGVQAEEADTNGVPIPFEKSLVFRRQVQFHPLKYLKALADAAAAAGVVILENTLVSELKSEDGVHAAQAGELQIKARNVIYATHLPPGINLLDFKCAPYRSYVLGVRLQDNNYPNALIYDSKEPYHYIRTHRINDEDYLLVGGEDHKTGHDDPEQAFQKLEDFVRQYYNVASVPFRWSSQYYVPDDGLPFIGQLPMGAKGIYIATGYNGNGMMFGTLSGMVLSNLINDEPDAYAQLFSPSRSKPLTGTMEFTRENADVAYHFVADRFSGDKIKEFDELTPGEGKLVKIDGKQVAAYRDEQGQIHALNPTCTHAGCIVNFNATEKTWDCPCHGGRFTIDGQVITGPPRKDLEPVELSNQS